MLVDTGATISFISDTLVKRLKSSPEVKRSKLSMTLGNGETHATWQIMEDKELSAGRLEKVE